MGGFGQRVGRAYWEGGLGCKGPKRGMTLVIDSSRLSSSKHSPLVILRPFSGRRIPTSSRAVWIERRFWCVAVLVLQSLLADSVWVKIGILRPKNGLRMTGGLR